MKWSDDLRRVKHPDGRELIGASFRGVPFFVAASERAGGRRTVTHEFPFRDDPIVDDQGRRARIFPIEGYVLGAGYVGQRDLLLAALEDVEGPGELVHPYHGVRRAICSIFSVRESVQDGGMATFAIEFAEAPVQQVARTEQADVAEQLFFSADAALAATQVEFQGDYDVEDMPSFALESAEFALETMATDMASALAPVVRVTQEAALLDQRTQILVAQASSLVRQPTGVLVAFAEALDGLSETFAAAPGDVLYALMTAYDADTGPIPPATTATRLREIANQAALAAALRRLLAIAAARLAALAAFESHEDATAARDLVAAALEEQAGLAGDAAYPALVQLRADLIRAVPGDAVLARILTIERRVSVPSLLLSYQLYGSVEQEADIAARNRARHPGFMAGVLTVLSDA